MLRTSLCDYSDPYIHRKGSKTDVNTEADGAAENNVDKKIILKNCVPFTSYISGINNSQIDNVYWCSNDNV